MVEFVVLIFPASSESFSTGENQRVNKSYSKNLPPSWVRGTKRSCMADKLALSSNATSPSFPTERKTTAKSKTNQNNINFTVYSLPIVYDNANLTFYLHTFYLD